MSASDVVMARLKKRKRAERRFRLMGIASVGFAILALGWLLLSVLAFGLSAFQQTRLTLDVTLSQQQIDPSGQTREQDLRAANYRAVLETALIQSLDLSAEDSLNAYALLSDSGATNALRQLVLNDPSKIGSTLTLALPASDYVDQTIKGHMDRSVPENLRKLDDQQLAWIDSLQADGRLKRHWNSDLFLRPDSSDPELAGIASAAVGSVMIVIISFLIAVPIGVGSAIYLDEFAPKNRFRDFVETNINNLAAVPSILFGLLGLAIFINVVGLARSIPLVGGMVMALRAFPTIVIATRSALQSVSPSIMDGALSLGASRIQAVFSQKLPLAAPGILTGSIIAMAQVLGETAPLLMIGMVAFVTEIPTSPTDPSSALPVQIFQWARNPEMAWTERTAAAILILLLILVLINALAIWLRHKLEKRL